jgi:hypothetical protein
MLLNGVMPRRAVLFLSSALEIARQPAPGERASNDQCFQGIRYHPGSEGWLSSLIQGPNGWMTADDVAQQQTGRRGDSLP